MKSRPSPPENYVAMRSEIIELFQAARRVAARNVNSLMTAVYGEIGRRIIQFEQAGEGAPNMGTC